MLSTRLRLVLLYSLLTLVGPLLGQPTFNYAEALQKSMFFYEAQRSGVLPANHRVTWRGPSTLRDGLDVGHDLSGGWFDASDHVKFGFPMAYSATALAWGAIDFKAGYVAADQLQFLKNNLRFVNDYFIKTHTGPNELWGQVGLGGTDHAFWGSAEVLMLDRPAFKIDATHPGSDLAAETAAAMAAASMVFAADDPAYSANLLQHAIQLYNFADNFRATYSSSIADARAHYPSFSGYDDELVWGAIWLYRATGDVTYLNKAEAYFENLRTIHGSTDKAFDWTIGWDDKSFGCYVLLAKLTGKAVYKAAAERNLDFWTNGLNGQRVRYTPGGLAYLDHFGTLNYAANASFLALYYSDIATTPGKATTYYNFAVRQINYILGDNPASRSYVVGFGANSPKNVHHRTAHGTWANNVVGPPVISRHTLYGALIGGPDSNDNYIENRSDFQQSEVATHYNALFSGALARLVADMGGTPLAQFPVAEVPFDEFLVEAKATFFAEGATEFTVWVNNHTAWPARIPDQFKFRIFIDVTEGVAMRLSPANYMVSSTSGDITFTNLLRWSSDANIYYTEVTFNPGTIIWPGGINESRKGASVRIGLPPGAPWNAWNPANDWSNQGVDRAVKAVNFIPLYADGVLVAGAEPPRDHLFPITGVTITPLTTSVVMQESIQLQATVSPANASNPAVTWISFNPARATVSPTGVVTGLLPGPVQIRAITVDGGFSATAVVTVLPAKGFIPLTDLAISPTSASLSVNDTKILAPIFTPTNATRVSLVWSSSNPVIADVSSTGVVTAFALGTATITATTADRAFSASAVITVDPPNFNCPAPLPITLNFTKEGPGEFCYVTTGDIRFINSWNMDLVEINGVVLTNRWLNSLPPKDNGRYVIHYRGFFPWSHLEINGSP